MSRVFFSFPLFSAVLTFGANKTGWYYSPQRGTTCPDWDIRPRNQHVHQPPRPHFAISATKFGIHSSYLRTQSESCPIFNELRGQDGAEGPLGRGHPPPLRGTLWKVPTLVTLMPFSVAQISRGAATSHPCPLSSILNSDPSWLCLSIVRPTRNLFYQFLDSLYRIRLRFFPSKNLIVSKKGWALLIGLFRFVSLWGSCFKRVLFPLASLSVELRSMPPAQITSRSGSAWKGLQATKLR